MIFDFWSNPEQDPDPDPLLKKLRIKILIRIRITASQVIAIGHKSITIIICVPVLADRSLAG